MNDVLKNEGYDSLATLIYVTDTEHEAVQRMFDWQELTLKGDDQLYYETYVQRGDSKVRVIAAKQNEMGMTAATALSMKLIYSFRPKYIIMPGIAAGTEEEVSDQQMYGDVVLASCVWNYSNGKYVSPTEAEIVFGEVGFIPRPSFIDMDDHLIEMFRQIADSNETECHLHIGPLASGSTVVANKNFLDKQIKKSYHHTKALEMEAYGVAYAAKYVSEPRPMSIIAKSVCDFADERKDDKYQKFAAFTSCEFVSHLVRNVLM